MNRRILGLLVVVAAVLGAWYISFTGDTETPELEEGYRALYNGKNLDGWRVIGGESTFAARGDEIVGHHGPGGNTFLRTEAEFANFSLKMQMRWDELGNSGVLFRSAQRDGDGRAYGYQYELDHSDRAWSGGIYDEARRGWLARLNENDAARAAIKLDDWNDVEIEARGPILKTWINGVPAADLIDAVDASGFIALQVHAGDIGIMRWRNIRIMELPGLGESKSMLAAEQWLDRDMPFTETGLLVASDVEPAWYRSKRELGNAAIALELPACAEPATLLLRKPAGEGSGNHSFVEVRLFQDRVESQFVNNDGVGEMTSVDLSPSDQLIVKAVLRDNEAVVSVNEVDAIRGMHADLALSGQLHIKPGRCDKDYEITQLSWAALKEASSEPAFYQTLDNEPAPVLTPEEALSRFRIAPGYEIELVAAEPLVEDPVAMAWDEWGRLYVVELRGYMPDAYGTGSEEPVGRIVRLEDTDRDGRMDKSEVFLDGLVNPRAIAVVNEGILIAEPPTLWLCELPTRDALCTSKKSVGGYATDVGNANVEHMENGLRQGLDNWLYNSKSTRSLRLADGALEEREGLFRGQWGITKDNYGRWFYNHNSTWLQADFFQAEDLVSGRTLSSTQGLGVNLTNPARVFTVRVNPGVNRAYLEGTLRPDGRLNKATGVSGLVYYRGDQFPASPVGHVYVPEVAGNVVAQFYVQDKGLEITATQQLYEDAEWGQRDFLGSTDERFRPVDAMNGPDGSLYIIDMYRGIVQEDHYLTDELREQIFERQLEQPLGMGRIWRVRHSEGSDTGSDQSLGDAGPQRLLAALSHSNGWTRDTAQRLLLSRAEDLQESLFDIARAKPTIPALHAIWTLEGRGELTRNMLLELLSMEDPNRQVQALRAGQSLLRSEDLVAILSDPKLLDERVAMQLAFAAVDHAKSPAIQQRLLHLLNDRASSEYIQQAVSRAVAGQELEFLEILVDAPAAAARSDSMSSLLQRLSANAYRTLRGDLTATNAAPEALLGLLQFTASRVGKNDWQQIALLNGFTSVINAKDFQPAMLAEAPPIFRDATISETNSLWNTRLQARAAYTWPGDELALGIKPLSPEQLERMKLGEAFYSQCAACHGDDGAGRPGLAPALAGVSWVTGPAEWLGRIILQGMAGPVEVNGEVFNGIMPAHGHLPALSDTTLAGLMTYVRRSWGNTADPVDTDKVASIRRETAGRKTPWTVKELEGVKIDRGFDRFIGKYSVSFLKLTVTEEVDGLHIDVPMYGGGKLDPVAGTDSIFFAKMGSESAKFEFVIDEDGTVNSLILHREGQKIPAERVVD